MSGPLKVDTSTAPSVASSRLSPSIGLTTFPNPFQDEPEQGILPALFSKVKQTFTSGAAPVAGPSQPKADKGGAGSEEQSWGYGGDYRLGDGHGLGIGLGQGRDGQREGGPVVQTEAQAIAEAVKRNRAQMAIAATAAAQAQAQVPDDQQARRQTLFPQAAISQPVDGAANVAGPSASPQPPHRGHTRSHRPPLSTVNSIGSTLSQPQIAPSIVSSHHSSVAPPKRTAAPIERHWKPSDVAPAQVTIFPVTTTVAVQNATASKEPPAPPPAPPSTGPVPFPMAKPFHRAHFGFQNAVPSSSRSAAPLHHHSHSNSMVMGAAQNRMRRASIATLPDSPSSASISGMLSGSLEQGQGYVPGFPLAQDDARSVRSLGVVRRLNSVSKVIRRMRGEGLSKQYWMADEHCKECYDCKSAFTAWRRKHHCRICGQIFCSRCASNIIGARRFGQEGVVRVCNLCLKIMEEYKDDDEDDRRSINSVSTSVHRYPSVSDRAFLDAAISPEMTYAKSPFAASQLFTSHPNESLTAIDESSVPTRWGGGEMDMERPYTPNDIGGSQMSEEDGQLWTRPPQTAAPFRRPMEEEQKMHEEEEDAQPNTPGLDSPDVGGDTSRHGSDTGHKGGEMRRGEPLPRLEFPRTYTASTDGGDGGMPLSRVDSHPLMSLRTRASQAGLTALLDTEKNEGLWRARSHSFASKQPEMLSGASLQHFHVMLEQAIARADLPKPAEWHRVLSNLILKVPINLQPNVRAGDDIDVRAYVKIKKVPGGKISDSEYVDGIVISKNVTHKAMPRRLVNPRIMVITFPLDYHRVDNQFMSLDPILAQEKDYLRLLTKRIIDVRPHIVLVGPTASRIALEYLLEADIAVARSVKNSAIHQVARCTQADILASMDRLVLQPRLGRCNEVKIETYDHDLIPGRRKTLMRFEGGNREQGGTIILRGGDMETLRKVKVVTDFMALVTYHLKNEVILYNDEHNILPPDPPLPTEYQELLELLREKEKELEAPDTSSPNVTVIPPEAETPSTPTPIHRGTDSDPETPTTPTPYRASESVNDQDDDRQVERREALEVSRQIARSLEPYLTTVLSASAAIRFPPPATLARMAQLDRRLAELRQSRDEEEAAQILEEETKAPEPPKTAVPPAAGADPETASISTVTSVGGEPPEPAAALEVTSSSVMSAIPAMSTISTAGGGMQRQLTRDPYRMLRKPEEVSRESALAQVAHEHAEQLKLWQWYNRRFTEQLRPENYQGIVYLSSLGCEGTEKPCVEPTLQRIDFYQPGDQTIGQFLESLAASAADHCPSKTCERLLLFHFHLLVHGERRLQIAMDQFPCPSPGHEDQIITWSYCRQCGTPSPTTIIREETWKLSWGSYLEHCFYPPETSAGFSCPHDAFRDQIRYFAHRNLAIRIHNEKIDLYEPCRPSISLQVKAETKVALKNREYESALAKNTSFFDSVLFRLKTIDYDMVQPEKVALLKTTLENMLSRAVADREEMVNLLNRTYKLTPVADVLALNTVLRSLQDKVVQWDSDFADVEKAFMPSEKDLRRMTASHLKRLFANQDVFSTLDRNVAGLTVSEVDERETKDGISPSDTPAATEPSTPALLTPTAGTVSEEPPSLDITSEGDAAETPLAGIVQPVGDSLAALVGSEAGEAGRNAPSGYASDSTVSAMRRESLGRSPVARDRVESSGMDSDAHPFVSRLPRRSRPAPSIADLVQRFNESTQVTVEASPEMDRSRSSGPARRQQHRGHEQDISDSDNSPQSRPRLRRGRTDQPPVRYREASMKPGLVSDGDRSYAANASRIPSSYGRQKTMPGGAATDYLRPGMRSRTPSYTGKPSPRSERVSPEPRSAGPSSGRQTPVAALEGKPRMGGKGKNPKLPETPSGRTSPSMMRTAARRTLASSSRVTSIARHFDRLSREAERERLKRMSIVRNKRARPVSVTKAKVQVFDNLRDAFRDEFDTDSSEADNEEDEMGSDDSLGSVGQPGQTKARRRSSPIKSRKSSPVKAMTPQAEPISVEPSPSREQGPSAAGGADNTVSESSVPAPSIFSDAKSEMSFTERLQIELPSFETSAPLPSHPATPLISNEVTTADEGKGTMSASQVSDSEFGTFSTTGERSSILKSLTGLWAFRAGEFAPLEYPLSASEHIFADSRVIIRENEPTSIIAFTLSSKTYRDNSRAWASNKAGDGKYETFMPEEGHTGDRTAAWDVVSLDDVDEPTRPEGGTHLKYDFESGASTIFCRIFFAEQFAALRKVCQCEDSFVESLARCVQFDASGGKSGSAFLKTKDDRFIAKEITRFEMDALTKFAPAYFEYTRKAFQGQRPTVLAKIYGFFKIGYHNAITGKYMKMNVLIMENLFYERRFTKIYDLKGSTRNRLIQPTGRVNEVLLDENLMEIVYKHPLYLRDQSKRILRTALFNDTLFLSNLNVMDYSLVVGVDQDKHELVVGIVDYIRTFTWDKKLESWVKDLGAGGKGEPTIVTPKQYKLRFRTAMERFYFPAVPDRWTKVESDEVQVEEEGGTVPVAAVA
ncbi:hypothetical protein IAT38_007256 [Cryptococcus sp. DSM 104549]